METELATTLTKMTMETHGLTLMKRDVVLTVSIQKVFQKTLRMKPPV